jgi:hypothetical protein
MAIVIAHAYTQAPGDSQKAAILRNDLGRVRFKRLLLHVGLNNALSEIALGQ